jgi:NHL repeat
VANLSNLRIEEFTAWGEFVKAWGWGVVDGTAALQVCTATSDCVGGLSGNGAGQFGSSFQGITVDGSGDVYVVDRSNSRVQKFDSEGNFLLMFGGDVNKTKVDAAAPEAEQNICPIAPGDVCQAGTQGTGNGQFGAWPVGSYIGVDPGAAPAEDTIYVGDDDRVQSFEPDGSYVKSIALAGEMVQSLAVDSAGFLYVAYFDPVNGFNNDKANVRKLDPNSATPSVPVLEFPVTNPRGVAVDPVGDVYVFDKANTEGLQFGPTASLKGKFAEDLAAESTGIAVGAACENGASVYVSNANFTDSFVRAYADFPDPVACPPPIVPPDINAQYAASVGTDNAVLRAEINPHFWVDTTYYLEYGTAKCTENTCTQQPLTPATLKGAKVDKDVTTGSIVLSGLLPGTTYHFRFVSESGGGGPVFGIDPDGNGPEEATFEDGLEGTFTTFTPSLPPKTDCPNQSFRSDASARLPDCRAHEMVSPIDKNNGDIAALTRKVHPTYSTALEQSSSDGEKIAYSAAAAFGDAQSAPFTSQYIASRKEGDAWFTHGVSPPRGSSRSISGFANAKFDNEYKAFSADLCSGYLIHDTDPILAPGAVPGYLNLYRRQNCGAEGYEALSTVQPPVDPATSYHPELQGFSADGKHTFFVAQDKLAANAAEIDGYQLYQFTSGASGPRYVCVLPGGASSGEQCSAGTPLVFEEGREDSVARAVSEDGSRVYWSAPAGVGAGPGPLYARVNPEQPSASEGGTECAEPEQACTVAVSEATATFWTATPSGSKALYTVGDELFEFDLGKALAAEEAQTLLAEGVLGVVGASEDLSRIYFVSTEALSGGEENSEGEIAEAGEPNLYLYEGGGEGASTTTYVGTLAKEDVDPSFGSPMLTLSVNPMRRASRVNPSGNQLAFTSTASLTGYDNTDVASGEADTEVFVYDAGSSELDCVSCNPTGARPRGRDYEIGGEKRGSWAAAQIPTWENQLYAPRALSEDGNRLFFESFERLVPRDTNGVQDVYEWERAASKAQCESLGAEAHVASSGGCLSLISSGEGPVDSEFADASPNGRDVFFRTASSLLPQDPGLVDLYDARELGGLPGPEPPEQPCQGEACQSPPPPPDAPTPSSFALQGKGNVKPARGCPKGKRSVRRKGKARCVPKPKAGAKGKAKSKKASGAGR